MLDWGNLEYFISCANHGTLSGCAKEMGVNHSTVSRKIEKLEKELAIKLFERRSSGYALTIHGKDLYKDCLLYTSPSPRDLSTSRMPSSA